jgi:hypothetical protein
MVKGWDPLSSAGELLHLPAALAFVTSGNGVFGALT